MKRIADRLLVWVTPGKAVVVDPADVYWIEAEDGHTWVRRRGRERLQDHRSLGKVVGELADFGFMRCDVVKGGTQIHYGGTEGRPTLE